jgi:hypothetical protein
MTEKFNDIEPLKRGEFVAVVNNNVAAPAIFLGKAGHTQDFDVAGGRELRDWLNRALPDDKAEGQS